MLVSMNRSEKLVARYQENLPGIVRDLLELQGVSAAMVSTARVGWNGRRITVPFVSNGELVFEYWEVTEEGEILLDAEQSLADPALYGVEDGMETAFEVFITEGVLECLVAKSFGITAIAATGRGVVVPLGTQNVLRDVDRVAVCLKRSSVGEAARIAHEIERAHVVLLPDEAPTLSAFFIDCGLSAGDLRRRSLEAYEAKRQEGN